MKKFKALLMMAVIATGAIFTSCEKDEEGGSDPKPTVAISAPVGTQTVAPGATVDVTVLASADNDGKKLKSFRVEFAANGAPYAAYADAFAGGENEIELNDDTYTYEGTLATLDSPGTIVYRFTAVDKDDESSSVTLTINVEANAPDINTFSAVLAGGQSNNTLGSFYATGSNTVYKQADAKTNATLVDMVYFYGSANEASLASPNSSEAGQVFNNPTNGMQTWSTRNNTGFKVIGGSEADFNAIEDGDALQSYVRGGILGSDPSQSLSNTLAAGDIIGFLTTKGKYGAIYVKAVNGTQDGTIEFDVKVQQ